MNLFNLGTFTLASGKESKFKIDCDALTDSDLQCIAWLISNRVPEFSAVEGVPMGGIRLAMALEKYCVYGADTLLIVDDVCTTGRSAERHRNGRKAIGACIFSRENIPNWIYPLFMMQ